MEEVIETRLSDGLSALLPGETDTMIAAGMGGGLVIRILDGNPEVTQSLKEFILQPQSEIRKVREYLRPEWLSYRCRKIWWRKMESSIL